MTATTAPAVQRARAFVENVLMPLEQEAERAGGGLPDATVAEIKRAAIAAGLQGGRVPAHHGGQGWSMAEWFAVNEQFGRVTGGLHWHVPNVYNVWAQASEEQCERYVRPALAGEGAAEDGFGFGVGVDVRSVEGGDADVERGVDAGLRGILLDLATVGYPVAVGDFTDVETALTEPTEFHAVHITRSVPVG